MKRKKKKIEDRKEVDDKKYEDFKNDVWFQAWRKGENLDSINEDEIRYAFENEIDADMFVRQKLNKFLRRI